MDTLRIRPVLGRGSLRPEFPDLSNTARFEDTCSYFYNVDARLLHLMLYKHITTIFYARSHNIIAIEIFILSTHEGCILEVESIVPLIKILSPKSSMRSIYDRRARLYFLLLWVNCVTLIGLPSTCVERCQHTSRYACEPQPSGHGKESRSGRESGIRALPPVMLKNIADLDVLIWTALQNPHWSIFASIMTRCALWGILTCMKCMRV